MKGISNHSNAPIIVWFQCFYIIFWIIVSKILVHNFKTLPRVLLENPKEIINEANINFYSDFILGSFQQLSWMFLTYKAFHIFVNYYFLLWLLINLSTFFVFIKRKESKIMKKILICLCLIDLFCLLSVWFYIYWSLYFDFFDLLWSDLFSSFLS